MPTDLVSVNHTFPGSPAAARAVPVRVDAFKDRIAYGSGNTVVVRSVCSTEDVVVCGLHSSPVTAVRFSPSGSRVASGDASGNLILWQNRAGTPELYRAALLQGAVRDICWTGDDERLVVVGEGRNVFAAAITTSGNTVGDMSGHSRNVLTCDMRRERPFRAVTGAADALVGFYEGVPFKFKHTVPGHQNTVTCVRYSPDLARVATASSLPEVLLLDGKTGEKAGALATPHKGTIFALAWSPDSRRLATASADKTVCILDASADGGAVLHHVTLGAAVADMQQGIAYTDAGVVAVSLGGIVTLIDDATGAVRASFTGHQSRVCFLGVSPADGALLSVSVDGRVLLWENSGAARVLPLPDAIANAATLSPEGTLSVVCGKHVVSFDGAHNYQAATITSEHGGHAAAVAAADGGRLVLVLKNKAAVLCRDGSLGAALETAALQPTCAAARGPTVVIGGERAAWLLAVGADHSLAKTAALEGKHTSGVCAVAVSADATRVATGDNSRNIVVWSAADGSVLFQQLTFHTLAVTALCFDPSGRHLLSGSVDCSVIYWDLDGGARRIQDGCHRGGVSAVAFGRGPSQLYSAGGDFCIRQWGI